MGWGCYKHEWDAGSDSWREHAGRLCEERLRTALDWGRDGQICPKCYEELLERHADELERLRTELTAKHAGELEYLRAENEALANANTRLQAERRLGRAAPPPGPGTDGGGP